MRFIYSLKSRIYQQQQEESARKRVAALRNKEELERLKKDIDARQERRKLLEMLEKEKERGLILDIELQEKQRMQKEKDALLRQIGEEGAELREGSSRKEKKSESMIADPYKDQQD